MQTLKTSTSKCGRSREWWKDLSRAKGKYNFQPNLLVKSAKFIFDRHVLTLLISCFYQKWYIHGHLCYHPWRYYPVSLIFLSWWVLTSSKHQIENYHELSTVSYHLYKGEIEALQVSTKEWSDYFLWPNFDGRQQNWEKDHFGYRAF